MPGQIFASPMLYSASDASHFDRRKDGLRTGRVSQSKPNHGTGLPLHDRCGKRLLSPPLFDWAHTPSWSEPMRNLLLHPPRPSNRQLIARRLALAVGVGERDPAGAVLGELLERALEGPAHLELGAGGRAQQAKLGVGGQVEYVVVGELGANRYAGRLGRS